jgi:hypothetical protein
MMPGMIIFVSVKALNAEKTKQGVFLWPERITT